MPVKPIWNYFLIVESDKSKTQSKECTTLRRLQNIRLFGVNYKPLLTQAGSTTEDLDVSLLDYAFRHFVVVKSIVVLLKMQEINLKRT